MKPSSPEFTKIWLPPTKNINFQTQDHIVVMKIKNMHKRYDLLVKEYNTIFLEK